MRIVVLEHFSSLPPDGPPAALRSEGRAVREAIAADFRAIPGVEVEVIDGSASSPSGAAGPGHTAAARRRDRLFRAALRRADAALVMAPETGGVLERLTSIVEEEGRLVIGCSSAAVRRAADKWEVERRLLAAGLPAPGSEVIRFRGATWRLLRRPLPFVLKPRDGCGGQGVVLVRRPAEIATGLAAVRAATARDGLLVQSLIPGEPVSVSVIAAASDRRLAGGRSADGPALLSLGLNRQRFVRRAGRFRYVGGEVACRHPQAEEAERLAIEAVAALARSIQGIRGHLGVDLILSPEGPRVIEVNPRLTTSCIGLRHVVRGGIARLILEAAAGRPLPARIASAGRCCFRADGRIEPAPQARRSVRPCSISAGTSAASI